MDYSKRQKLIEKLAEARREAETGKLSRRDFNTFLVGLAAAAGVSLSHVEEANAWVGTRMRKPKRTSAASYGNSLRFDSARSTQLTRNFASGGDRQKFTFSFWAKPTGGAGEGLLSFNYAGGGASQSDFYISFVSNKLSVVEQNNNSATWVITTTAVFRDPSAWYHFVVSVDTTQAVASQRAVIYVNGTAQSLSTSTYPSLNYNNRVSVAGSNNHIGCIDASGGYYIGYNGYLADFFYIDGQALTPWSFADIDPSTGQYIPKTYGGTYGTNGFYLKFNDASTVAAIGTDSSGGSKTWTVSNHATTDVTLDAPSNNFCILSTTDLPYGLTSSSTQAAAKPTMSNGALRAMQYENSNHIWGTFALRTGKWYYEVTMETMQRCGVGIRTASTPSATALNGAEIGYRATEWGLSSEATTVKVNNNNQTSLTHAAPSAKVFQVALDLDSGKIWFGRDNTWLEGNPAAGTGASFTLTTGVDYIPGICFGGDYTTSSHAASVNFGQGGVTGCTFDAASGGSFKHAPPSGFKAISAVNLPAPTIVKPGNYFAALTYTGNGGVQRIGGIIPATQSYQVSRSLRFNSADGAYLHRTPGAAGNRRTWTLSMWVKRAALGTAQALFYSRVYPWSGVSGTDFQTVLYFDTDDTLKFGLYTNAFVDSERFTNRTFKNVSEWMHVLVAVDTTLATAADRVKIYVNGMQETSFSSSPDPAQNYQSSMHDVAMHHLGNMHASNGAYNTYYSGYLAEVNAIDGQALTPSSFGETDTTSGEWVPKSYGGTYGTNGFYLNFSDNSNTTAATLGKDSSVNGSNWTPINFSIAAGVGNDSLTDSPSNYGTDSGGTTDNSRGNFCTLDLLATNATSTVNNGALYHVHNSGTGTNNYGFAYGTLTVSSGKFYSEATWVSAGYPGRAFGWRTVAAIMSPINGNAYGWSGAGGTLNGLFGLGYFTGSYLYVFDGNDADTSSYTGSIAAGDTIGVAIDLDAGKIWVRKNGGAWYGGGDPATGTSPTKVFPPGTAMRPASLSYKGTDDQYANFGQRPFAYAPPSGFKCLNTRNLPSVDSRAMTGQPDLVWIKSRSAGTDHAVYDSSRGYGMDLVSNSAAAETAQSNGVAGFSKTGFIVGSLAKVNTSGATYVAWEWKKGTTPGFDIVLDVGTGVAKTIAHSLGTIPTLIIRKSRTSSSGHWYVYHASVGAASAGILQLNNAFSASSAWNSTIPTSSVFSVGSAVDENKSGDNYVTYLWSEVAGFSKFGGYAGTGSADGPFVWCGFRPAFVIVKRYDGGSLEWMVLDNARDPQNPMKSEIKPNNGGSEASNERLDFLSNGFKVRTTSNIFNASSASYIFIAFAEAPYKYAGAR